MSLTLHDISVVPFTQTLDAVAGFLRKSAAHWQDHDIDPDDIVETRLHPDMLPFRFQLLSVAHHTMGAIKGIQAGVFTPPAGGADLNFSGLQGLIADAREFVGSVSRETINALEHADVQFRLGADTLPFTATGFVLTFSLPNMHFHATTAYDILRMQGVPLGKRDYMGRPQLKA